MGITVSKGNSPYNVSSGQTDTNDVVVSGGSMFVLSGGTANTTAVSSGGIMTIKNGGAASGTTVFAGGTEIISSGGIDVNATVNSGGTIEFFGGIAAPYYSLAGSIIEVISGFFPGPLFALGSVTVKVLAGATGTGGVLTVTSGGTANVVAKIDFTGHYATSNFHLEDDGSGHVKIVDPSTNEPQPGIAYGAATTLGYSESGVQTGGFAMASNDAAAIVLLGNYMAASFATAADGHAGQLTTVRAQTASEHLSLITPHKG